MSEIISFVKNHFAIILSTISLLLSLINFSREMIHLKFNVNSVSTFKDKDNQFLIINLSIDNRSKNNITINYVDTLINKLRYISILNEISLGGTGIEIAGQTAEWVSKSIQMPIKLSSYDSCSGSIIIPISYDVIIPKKLKLYFNTSRGKKCITINCELLQLN